MSSSSHFDLFGSTATDKFDRQAPYSLCSSTQVLPTMARPTIHGYHAHVYFSQATLVQAKALCLAAAQKFELVLGRVHEKPVGPHPDWSCQLAFKPEIFGHLVPWLAMNRSGLVVFVHPLSDNELLDHAERALWMGEMRPLDLRVLTTEPEY